MKTATMISAIAASAAVVSAQVTLQNGTYTCAQPNVAYCAGGSLMTDIIIRCNAQSIGQPGRCGDNLAGEPPLGNTPALCYQTGNTTGDAACEKNCVVYGSSGNANGTFTLPTSLCTPTYTATTSTSSSTTTVTTSTSTGTGSDTTTTTTDSTVTTTACPCSSSQDSQTTQTMPPTTTGPTTTSTPNNVSTTTTARPPPVTAAAVMNVGSGALAALGLAAAYLL